MSGMNTVENGRKPLAAKPDAPIAYKKELFYRYIANMKRDADDNKVTMAEFCKIVGLDNKTVYAWQNEEDFHRQVAKRVDEMFVRWLPRAGVIARSWAAKGSYKHLELIYKQADALKADRTITEVHNVDSALE